MSAIDLLKKAIAYDVDGRKTEALKLYEDGINELFNLSKAETNVEKKNHYKCKILEYMERAEHLKKLVKSVSIKGELIDKIHIVDGAIGYSYKKIFNKYLTQDCKEIVIEEPYIREFHQYTNLVMFSELAVSNCRNLNFIRVLTVEDKRQNSEQKKAFTILGDSLKARNIFLFIEYSDSIHDRQIILSNGYIIKIGRGLNYFKASISKYCLGAFDYNFRECKETNIDILYCNENKK